MIRQFFKSRTVRIGLPAFLLSAATVLLDVWNLLDAEMVSFLRGYFGPEAFMLLAIAMLVMRVITSKALRDR